ncbi:MAG: hypothetical protein GY731_19120 [Gammaproteobacteria bacterium]|nr:hypothetical protein [Gammaproteobacteria bacterium]
MAEYNKLNFLDPDYISPEEEAGRQETIAELYAFVCSMRGMELAVVTLDETQSAQWDQSGEIDYQDRYGREIINQVADGTTRALVIHNALELPVAMAVREDSGRWQGIGVDERLREMVTDMLVQELG